VNRRRRQAALVLVAFCVVVPSAAANGDPASDVLPTQNIYLPYEAPSAAAAKTLKRAVEAAYARHFRVKVAVIANQIDLGDVPSLWGKPNQYAKFLGTELDPFYVGPLLIVMPAGFGVYDGGRSVAAEERILGSIAVKGADSDSLTSTAADVVTRLLKARALRSKDIRSPLATAFSATVHRGKTARLVIGASDDSGWSKIVARVLARSRAIATLKTPLVRLGPAETIALRWEVPRTVPTGTLRLCVVAWDPAGNRSAKNCGVVTVA
jgi:hypothetical protein